MTTPKSAVIDKGESAVTTPKKEILQSLWDFFCSLKLTMFLLIALAVTSIIGTIVPQGTPPEQYLANASLAKLKLYKALGFFDMYHSWWFILLLYLLTVNLIACSVKRLPHIWKIITEPATLLTAGLEKTLAAKAHFKTQDDPATLKDRAAAFLKAEFVEPVVTEADGDWHLFAEKTAWCRLSVYFVHLSIIIIFIGAIIGSLFGYKGFVNILEGESVSSTMTRANKPVDLGFAVRCEKFSVAHYPNGAPREFKSILTVLENGKPVPDYTNVRVIVNDPLTYKGITFYQSSYGNAGDYYFTLSDRTGSKQMPVTVRGKESVTLPDGSSIQVVEATEDVSAFAKGVSGPAAQVELHAPNGQTETFVTYANHPELNVQRAASHNSPLVIHYKGAQEKMYTGLQVAKDPGVWVVWLGCALMVIGVYAAFFLSHRRIWIRVQSGSLTIGGNASKNPGAFQRSFEELVERLNTQLIKEK